MRFYRVWFTGLLIRCQINLGVPAAENDWQLPQNLPTDAPLLETSLQKFYGFLNSYHGYFVHVTHTENEVNELGDDTEKLSLSERRRRRIQHENDKWDPEYYMYALFNMFQIGKCLYSYQGRLCR